MEQIPSIRIGRGSSNFYSNLIRAYLKNHEKVIVIAGGYRINMAIWICFFIHHEYRVEKINTHFLDDLKIQTIFSFQVTREAGGEIQPYYIQNEYLPTLKICNYTSMRSYREAAQLNDVLVIVAAGRMCAKALFLNSHLYKDGFSLKSLQITKVLGNGDYKAGIRIEVFKSHRAYICDAKISEGLREEAEEASM